jgi:hypothetical protein
MGITNNERIAQSRRGGARSGRPGPTWWYLTLGGCHVAVSASGSGNYSYRCTGCDVQSVQAEGRLQALSHASQHAAQCRAMSNPRSRDAAEIARELAIDVRAELPRIDARAAAGIALSAAVLIGTVGQPPPTMPGYAFAVVAAGLLTLALLLFFTVLLPVSAEGRHASLRRWASFENGEALVAELASWDRAVYHATAAIELSSVVRAKHSRLTLALAAGALALLALASGASLELFLGSR